MRKTDEIAEDKPIPRARAWTYASPIVTMAMLLSHVSWERFRFQIADESDGITLVANIGPSAASSSSQWQVIGSCDWLSENSAARIHVNGRGDISHNLVDSKGEIIARPPRPATRNDRDVLTQDAAAVLSVQANATEVAALLGHRARQAGALMRAQS